MLAPLEVTAERIPRRATETRLSVGETYDDTLLRGWKWRNASPSQDASKAVSGVAGNHVRIDLSNFHVRSAARHRIERDRGAPLSLPDVAVLLCAGLSFCNRTGCLVPIKRPEGIFERSRINDHAVSLYGHDENILLTSVPCVELAHSRKGRYRRCRSYSRYKGAGRCQA